MKRTTKDVLVIMLCTTVCATILMVVSAAAFGSKQLSPESAAKMFDLVTYTLGTVAGYLLSSGSKAE